MTDNTEFDNLRTLRAAERVAAYLNELDRIYQASGGTGAQQANTVHAINDFDLRRTDLRALLVRLDEVTAERDALAAVIEAAKADATNPALMDSRYGTHTDRKVIYDTLTTAPSSVLAAHDAKVRAEALRDAANEYPLPQSAGADWLRARADKEENR